MKKYQRFLSENFQFLEVKFSIYLNRRVFVMTDLLLLLLLFFFFFFFFCFLLLLLLLFFFVFFYLFCFVFYIEAEPENYDVYFYLNTLDGTVNKTKTMNASDPRKYVLFIQVSTRAHVCVISHYLGQLL